MKLELHDSHFKSLAPGTQCSRSSSDSQGDSVQDLKRPVLPTLASASSVPTATTAVLSRPAIDTRDVIDTREGYTHERALSSTERGGLPSLNSVENDLEVSLAQVMLESHSVRSPRHLHSQETIPTEYCISEDELESQLSATQVNELDEEGQVNDFLARPKHFLILSAAGKPIYSRHGTEQIVPGYMAVIQAMMGFYQESTKPDVLQSFSAPNLQLVMLIQGPIYLVAISKLGEEEGTLHGQLKFLYDVLLSNVTMTRMGKLFARGDNFDLGRLLIGSEQFMDTICDQMTSGMLHFDVRFSSLSVFRLRSTLRVRINNILAHYRPTQNSEFLCGIVAVNKKLVSVLHPKGLSLYPADLRIVFETVWSRGIDEGLDHWLPLCLPNLNSSGYLHIYVSFLASSIATILISSSKDDFYVLQDMKQQLQKKLIKEGLIQDLIKAKRTQVTTESLHVSNIAEHFIFRSREHVQYLMPPLPPEPHPCRTRSAKQPRRSAATSRLSSRKLFNIYQTLIVTGSPMYKLQVRRIVNHKTENLETQILALTWFTNSFELYVISRPFFLPRGDIAANQDAHDPVRVNELIGAANVIHQFVKREEKRVWVDDGVTF